VKSTACRYRRSERYRSRRLLLASVSRVRRDFN